MPEGGGGGSQPPINASFSGSAQSGAAISGNIRDVFGDHITNSAKAAWWKWALFFGVVLILATIALLIIPFRPKAKT